VQEDVAEPRTHPAAAEGGGAEVDVLFAAAYEDLRHLARLRLQSGGRDAVLDTTALVHESFLRLANMGRVRPEDRAHFLRYAGRTMRSIIVDNVRRRQAERRGGGAEHVPWTTRMGDDIMAGDDEILRVHEALEQLAILDERLAQVVEMRYFAGMTEAEIGRALGHTERTVRRDWGKARALLARDLA
jgi:RNA polymerase sigma factor (TIGR02999 family)